jgi:ParB family transcriptional regulator, chromosome partitioning protein
MGPTAGTGPDQGQRASTVELARRLTVSARLQQRRFELVPVSGARAPFTEEQGRAPGDSTTPAGLVELISSIATVGVLQPILLEELPDGSRKVVAGERRLMAVHWGAANQPHNPHFQSIPAVICPGPLWEEERRVWQLVENLAREDLQPGELAAALMYERCAVLTSKLVAAEVPVPGDLPSGDPNARWRALDQVRVQHGQHHIGAPWGEVLRRLGLQLSVDRAKQLVRAFKALPAELSEEMDAEHIALATRMEFLRLDRGRTDAAQELWAAIKARKRPELLAAAIRETTQHPDLAAEEALDRAGEFREASNAARAAALRWNNQAGDDQGEDESREVAPADVAGLIEAFRDVLAQLRNGRAPDRYNAGSLRLLAAELLELLEQPPAGRAVVDDEGTAAA